MKTPLSWLALCAAASLVADGGNGSLAAESKAIPYVPTREDIVKDLLWLAQPGTNDVVYDMGSGDGRVVISAARDYHVREAVGIERTEPLVCESRKRAEDAGVTSRVRWIHGDLFTNDFSRADVLALYIGQGANIELRPRIFASMKPGSRVATHQFGMGEWKPDKRLILRTQILGMYGEMAHEFRRNPNVPDFDAVNNRATHHEILSWVVPARVAGSWTGPVRIGAHSAELTLTLHQRLSEITGTFQFTAATNISGRIAAELLGDRLRFWCTPDGPEAFRKQIWFEGHARGDLITGEISGAGDQTPETGTWEGSRKRSEYTGTWEWAGLSNAPVQLKIERSAGRYIATYSENQGFEGRPPRRNVPVKDFYDFGGGFYFTLLLGLEGNMIIGTRRTGPGDGWLIGEAIEINGELVGSLAYFPYSDTPGSRASGPGLPAALKPWRAKRVAR